VRLVIQAVFVFLFTATIACNRAVDLACHCCKAEVAPGGVGRSRPLSIDLDFVNPEQASAARRWVVESAALEWERAIKGYPSFRSMLRGGVVIRTRVRIRFEEMWTSAAKIANTDRGEDCIATVFLDTSSKTSYSRNLQPGQFDGLSLARHEIGHAIGIMTECLEITSCIGKVPPHVKLPVPVQCVVGGSAYDLWMTEDGPHLHHFRYPQAVMVARLPIGSRLGISSPDVDLFAVPCLSAWLPTVPSLSRGFADEREGEPR